MLQNISCLGFNCSVSWQPRFSFHQLAYEAGSGRGNCCPSDIEAGRHTTSRDPYPIAEFQTDSKKMALAEAQTSFCVHLSVCLCLSQALFSSAQMISISLSFFFFSLPPLNANLRLVRASKSLFKRRLQWDWPAHHTWYRQCSVNHTSRIWTRKWQIRALGWVEGGTFKKYFCSLHSPSMLNS